MHQNSLLRYRHIDGVFMGSPLGPTSAEIIMTDIEDKIIKELFDSNIIKFYTHHFIYTSISQVLPHGRTK